jgi:YesN/AraC family two-component response regulator
MEAPKKLKSSRNRNEYLTKPINKETLFQVIKNLNLEQQAHKQKWQFLSCQVPFVDFKNVSQEFFLAWVLVQESRNFFEFGFL